MSAQDSDFPCCDQRMGTGKFAHESTPAIGDIVRIGRGKISWRVVDFFADMVNLERVDRGDVHTSVPAYRLVAL